MAKKGETKASSTEDSKRQRRYNSSPEQKKRRAQRNKARREMERKGKVSKGDGKDVDHKDYNTSNGGKNLRVMDKSKNRARNRSNGGKRKGK